MVDELNVEPGEDKEKQEYIDDMVAKAEGKDEETSESEDLLAGKYKTEEELQKGMLEILQKQHEGKNLEEIYKELESGLGNSDEEEEVTDEETSTEIPEKEETESEEEEEGKESVDFSKYEQELMENDGELTEESYEELEEMGYPKQMVDQYIEGLRASKQAEASQIFEVTDGEDNYRAMIDWAQDNLSSEEIETFNQQVNAGVNSAKFAAEALYSRYTKANGSPPKNLVQGEAPTNIGNDVYQSTAELREDMSNPKYNSDPAFRKKVEQKLARSDIL